MGTLETAEWVRLAAPDAPIYFMEREGAYLACSLAATVGVPEDGPQTSYMFIARHKLKENIKTKYRCNFVSSQHMNYT